MEYCLDSMRETYSNYRDGKSHSVYNNSSQSMLNSAQSPLKDGFAADFGRKSLFQTQLDRLEGSFEDDDKSEGDLSECEDPIEELLKSI